MGVNSSVYIRETKVVTFECVGDFTFTQYIKKGEKTKIGIPRKDFFSQGQDT